LFALKDILPSINAQGNLGMVDGGGDVKTTASITGCKWRDDEWQEGEEGRRCSCVAQKRGTYFINDVCVPDLLKPFSLKIVYKNNDCLTAVKDVQLAAVQVT
jgi:hypothetical protein